MSATEIVPVNDAASLEQDPVAYMALVLNRAKGWLAEAQRIEDVREQKAYALTLETAIREKELGFDAQLSATEIVRRCERRIGELVREGQKNGTVLRHGDNQHLQRSGDAPARPVEAAGVRFPSEVTPLYEMADASPSEFESAIAEAREEGNLSRANVVRKVKGEPTPERAPRKPAAPRIDTARGQTVAASHARRFTDLTNALAGYAQGIQNLDITLIRAAMEPEELEEWTRSLGASLNKLRRFRSDLQEGRN